MKSRGDEMKKSVIITIIVIYVLAIVVVGFIGLKMKVYDEQKYVEKIADYNGLRYLSTFEWE